MTDDSPDRVVPDITCKQVTESTSAYLDERLDVVSSSRVAFHLAACAGCQAYVVQIAMVRQLLGELPEPAAEPTNLERLRRAFALQQKRSPPAT